MDWQDYTVWTIGAIAAVVVLRRMWRFLCGRRRGGCASCAAVQCPLRNRNRATEPEKKKTRKR